MHAPVTGADPTCEMNYTFGGAFSVMRKLNVTDAMPDSPTYFRAYFITRISRRTNKLENYERVAEESLAKIIRFYFEVESRQAASHSLLIPVLLREI